MIIKQKITVINYCNAEYDVYNNFLSSIAFDIASA